MKSVVLLTKAAVVSAALFTAFSAAAQNSTVMTAQPAVSETKATDQPFVHPSDDASYAKDMRDDEMLAKSKSSDNGNVQYVSGGIAVSGMRAIDAEEQNYNLKMLFVANGEYLADVGVIVTDSSGKNILDTATKGPVLLAKMHPGRYEVNAVRAGGGTLKRNVEVSSDHLASYVLRFPPKAK